MKTLKVADLQMHTSRREVYRRGRFIKLSGKEYAVLEFLMVNCGRVFSKRQLLEYIWHQSSDILTKTVEIHISNLRQKIDYDCKKRLIQTIFGKGYRVSELF